MINKNKNKNKILLLARADLHVLDCGSHSRFTMNLLNLKICHLFLVTRHF